VDFSPLTKSVVAAQHPLRRVGRVPFDSLSRRGRSTARTTEVRDFVRRIEGATSFRTGGRYPGRTRRFKQTVHAIDVSRASAPCPREPAAERGVRRRRRSYMKTLPVCLLTTVLCLETGTFRDSGRVRCVSGIRGREEATWFVVRTRPFARPARSVQAGFQAELLRRPLRPACGAIGGCHVAHCAGGRSARPRLCGVCTYSNQPGVPGAPARGPATAPRVAAATRAGWTTASLRPRGAKPARTALRST